MTCTAEPDLLPCPGCNGASVRVIGGPGTKGGPQYWAGCDHCRWRTWGNTESEAIAAWNTRAAVAELIEKSAAALHYMRLHKYADQAWADDLAEALARVQGGRDHG